MAKLHIVRFGVLGSFDADFQKIHSYYVTIKEGGGQRFSSGLYYEKHLNFVTRRKGLQRGLESRILALRNMRKNCLSAPKIFFQFI